ncbi:hypothetical protein ACLOJK_010304 [Asimina triloba]
MIDPGTGGSSGIPNIFSDGVHLTIDPDPGCLEGMCPIIRASNRRPIAPLSSTTPAGVRSWDGPPKSREQGRASDQAVQPIFERCSVHAATINEGPTGQQHVVGQPPSPSTRWRPLKLVAMTTFPSLGKIHRSRLLGRKSREHSQCPLEGCSDRAYKRRQAVTDQGHTGVER